MMRLPKTVPIPAPEPATPTVAAPAPMNLAAVSMSLLIALVWNPLNASWVQGFCVPLRSALPSPVRTSGRDKTDAEIGLYTALDPARIREVVDTNLAQAYMSSEVCVGFGWESGQLSQSRCEKRAERRVRQAEMSKNRGETEEIQQTTGCPGGALVRSHKGGALR